MVAIRDVAKLAGVSVATVSYVINGGPRPVTAETREKVLRAMEALEYHPNVSARRLAQRRTQCVGLALAGLGESNFASSYFLEYIRGISHVAENNGYNVMLFTSHRQVQSKAFYRRVIRSKLVDGLLLLGSSIPDESVVELWEKSVPAVLIARKVQGYNGGFWVSQDYAESTRRAVEHLIAEGYRRIAFLGQALQFSYGAERLEGYRQALEEAGLPYDPALVSVPPTPRDDPSPEEVAQVIEAGAEAVLTDRELAVLTALRQLGKRIPEEVALVGLDESESAAHVEVPLTSVRPPKFEMGCTATELLLKLIDGAAVEQPQVVLPAQLNIRLSSRRKSALGGAHLHVVSATPSLSQSSSVGNSHPESQKEV